MAQVAFALGKNAKAIWMGSSKSRQPSPAPKRGTSKPPLLCAADFVIGVICPWLALNLVPLSGEK